jgi:integrase
MATLSVEASGRRRIQFFDSDGQRRSVSLGKKVPMRTVMTWKAHIEALALAVRHGHAVDDAVASWVSRLGDKEVNLLAEVGLAPRRQTGVLGPFLASYFEARKQSIKGSTGTIYGHTRRCLLDFFGPAKAMRDICAGDADRWRSWLSTHEGLADNTIRRRCGIARMIFKAAQRQRLIGAENPFSDLAANVRGNPARYYFVSRDETDAVLRACPDVQSRLLFALSRYGGLRCPSEHLALRWGDIDFDNGSMHVRSPKTAHHEGGESRMVPLLPELRPYLEAAFAEAEAREDWSLRPDRPMSAEPVITKRRDATTNMRTMFTKIIVKAGLNPWPKLFQNLRSSRETELAETFPIQAVCQWIGNTAGVAAKHYLQTTAEHFTRAATEPTEPVEKTVQKVVQNTAESACTEPHQEMAVVADTSENPVFPKESGGSVKPSGGRTKTRTWDLGLIRAAL